MFSQISKIWARFCTFKPKDFSKTKVTKLTDRSLLVLHGPDSHKLLQGIMTNDVRLIKQNQIKEVKFQRIAFYTLFLQTKGKLISDAFVFQPRIYNQEGKCQYATDQLWLDVPKKSKNQLKSHLRKYTWKKQVQIHDVDEDAEQFKPTVYSGYNPQTQVGSLMLGGSIELDEFEKGEEGSYSNLIYYDPRGKQFGIRIVSMQPELSIEGHAEQQNSKEHAKLMQRLGEAPHNEAVGKLPFQFNYDMMNAISLKKGCFLGQEIVSRGLMTGIVRRRIFPFVLDHSEQLVEAGAEIKGQNDEVLGKVLCGGEGQGVGLINYIGLLEKEVNWPVRISAPFQGKLLNPFGQSLSKYYNDLKHKQKILEQLDL